MAISKRPEHAAFLFVDWYEEDAKPVYRPTTPLEIEKSILAQNTKLARLNIQIGERDRRVAQLLSRAPKPGEDNV